MRIVAAILCSVLLGFGIGYRVKSHPPPSIDTVRIVYPDLQAALNGMRNGDIIEVDRYDYQKASPIKLIRMDSISQVKEAARQKYSDSVNQIYLIRAIAHGQHCKCCMDSLIFNKK